MDLGVVLSCLSEYVNDGAAGILGLFWPVGDAYDGFVSGHTTLEFTFGDEDVAGQEFGICLEESHVFIDLQCADECLFFLLDYLYHLCLRFETFAACGDVDSHAVAVEGVHGVALCHEYHFVVFVGDDGVLSV